MAKKKPQVPADLDAFIQKGNTTFHAEDGDWDLKIANRDDSGFKSELPARSIVIAENGSGDCLFLKTSAAGKADSKVFVYWHEEERSELFAKSIKELIATSAKNKGAAAKEPKPAKAAAKKASLDDVEKALKTKKGHERWAVLRNLRLTEYGIEALPMLRRALGENDASMVIEAAKCIAKLGPEAATCPAGEARQPVAEGDPDQADLFDQLKMRGAKIWSYSGCANAYSDCLDALVKLEYDEDDLVEYVQLNVGHQHSLEESLEALSSVGTSEARDLAKRAVAFWADEMNMSETKKAKALLASFGSKGKKK
jgi:hypothetical protein